ncbi:MAG: Flp family type IVb pilin [Phyllobacteriaceae bacterium]|nr:Flp family type IVb pilin [Phyllobacteriaceae bacterium]MBA89488.1 Flp family type IVb pilin [Phyllobacteriaceae bacterium]MBA90627.1 Flp family type IVb pilin [Phyllobacteriaceae bacterium]
MPDRLNRREFLFGRRTFKEDERGATAIQYGLIAGLVALAITAPLDLFGRRLIRKFNCIRQTINGWTTTNYC